MKMKFNKKLLTPIFHLPMFYIIWLMFKYIQDDYVDWNVHGDVPHWIIPEWTVNVLLIWIISGVAIWFLIIGYREIKLRIARSD